ncbi:hypothetical protein NFI96_007595, partial [Prochilodus magdalenae]
SNSVGSLTPVVLSADLMMHCSLVTMGKYTVQVFTGNNINAGTSNSIFIKFIGTNCNSKPHQLVTMTCFWAGSEQTFTLDLEENIGELLLIVLEAKPPSCKSCTDDEWFCSKIIVTTPEGARMLFPCYRWMNCDKKLVLRNSVEYVQENWRRDDFFGYQFLNGLNPMIIRRCSELPEKFPVTDEMVQGFLPQGSTLKSEMKKGNIFLCDYERLKDLDGNEIKKKKQYLAAPLCLLFSSQGKLVPIAIQ